ncbi:MAG: hypothetical protein KUG79_08370 [Pseudomonadales bacterium]|nr:hypothetical protein [Pseudomonadales bacterium]
MSFALGLIGCVLTIFGLLEGFSDNDSKRKFTNIILHTDDSTSFLINTYLGSFDRLFACDQFPGSMFTAKFFFRSMFVSLCVLLTVLLYYESRNGYVLLGNFPENPSILLKFFLYILLFNVVIDYFSIVETRCLLDFVSKGGIGQSWFKIIVVDLLLTGLIFLVPVLLVIGVIFPLVIGFDFHEIIARFSGEFWKLIRLLTYESMHQTPVAKVSMGVFFWTTFASTLWVIVYVGVTRVTAIFLKVVNIQWAIPVAKHPYILAGLCVSFIIFVMALIYELLKFLF